MAKIAADFNTPNLSVEDKVGLLTDALALSVASVSDPSGLIALVRGCKTERNANVVGEACAILGSLGKVLRYIGDENVINKFNEFAKNLFLDGVKEVGFDNKADDDDNVKRLRNLFLSYAAAYCYEDSWVAGEAQKRFDSFCNDRKSVSGDARSAIFKIVVKNGGDATWDKLKELHSTVTDPAERTDYYQSMGAIKSEAGKVRTLEFAVSPDVRAQDLFQVLAGVANTPGGATLTSQWIQDNFASIHKLLGKASMMLMGHIVRISGSGLYGSDDADKIQKFWDERGIAQAKKTVDQTVEQIRVNAKYA